MWAPVEPEHSAPRLAALLARFGTAGGVQQAGAGRLELARSGTGHPNQRDDATAV